MIENNGGSSYGTLSLDSMRYQYGISPPCDICTILLTSQANPGKNTSKFINERVTLLVIRPES